MGFVDKIEKITLKVCCQYSILTFNFIEQENKCEKFSDIPLTLKSSDVQLLLSNHLHHSMFWYFNLPFLGLSPRSRRPVSYRLKTSECIEGTRETTNIAFHSYY